MEQDESELGWVPYWHHNQKASLKRHIGPRTKKSEAGVQRAQDGAEGSMRLRTLRLNTGVPAQCQVLCPQLFLSHSSNPFLSESKLPLNLGSSLSSRWDTASSCLEPPRASPDLALKAKYSPSFECCYTYRQRLGALTQQEVACRSKLGKNLQ